MFTRRQEHSTHKVTSTVQNTRVRSRHTSWRQSRRLKDAQSDASSANDSNYATSTSHSTARDLIRVRREARSVRRRFFYFGAASSTSLTIYNQREDLWHREVGEQWRRGAPPPHSAHPLSLLQNSGFLVASSGSTHIFASK